MGNFWSDDTVQKLCAVFLLCLSKHRHKKRHLMGAVLNFRPRPICPWGDHLAPTVQDIEWVSGPIWTMPWTENSLVHTSATAVEAIRHTEPQSHRAADSQTYIPHTDTQAALSAVTDLTEWSPWVVTTGAATQQLPTNPKVHHHMRNSLRLGPTLS
jgi:hypothetical protein